MESMSGAFKSLRIWQVAVLVLILLGAGAGTYGAYLLATREDGNGLEANQQLIPVQLGDLINDVSVNGSLVYANMETLRFSTAGTVAELGVEEGQRVELDQVLARLDAETIANLEKVVAQRKIRVRSAEEALEAAQSKYTDLELAKSQADVSNARLSLKNAEDALDALTDPPDLDVAKSQADVSTARLNLENAEEALATLIDPPNLDVAKAQSAVADTEYALVKAEEAVDGLGEASDIAVAQAEDAITKAKTSVRNARDALETATTGPSEDDVADAQAAGDSAAAALGFASGDLKLAQRDWDGNVEEAEEAFLSASNGYVGTFSRWFGVDIAESANVPPDQLLESWQLDLETLFDPYSQSARIERFATDTPRDDPQTPWNEFVVHAWLAFFPGTVLATCEDGDVPPEFLCVAREIDDAWQALQSAEDSLDVVLTQSAKALANAETAVTNAVEKLSSAEEALMDLKVGPDALDLETKQAALALAEASLAKAEEDLVALLAGPDDLELNVERRQVDVAKANLAKAEEDLVALLAGPDDSDLDAKRRQVDIARANLAEAEEDLHVLTGGIDPLDLDVKERQVELARASLAEAEDALAELGAYDELEMELLGADVISARGALEASLAELDGATLKAPFAGIVSALNVEMDQQVNPNTSVLEMVDPSVMEVDGIVDEIDVLFIREGFLAKVTLDALPGQVLDGAVSALGTEARIQQGVVSYPIRIRVASPQDVQLPEGLSALASVVIREDRGVLLVPLQALYGTFEQPVVRVMSDGRIEERPVLLGNSDDFYAVVVEGLAEAELVVMESQEATTGGFGFGGGFRGFGGQGGFTRGFTGGRGSGGGGGGR